MSNKNLKALISDKLVDYPYAVQEMEKYVALIHEKKSPELIWFLQHHDLYTAGTSADDKDLLDHTRFPVYKTGRGGQYTYHGPGQLIAYVMLDIQTRKIGVREYIQLLEQTIIDTLAECGITGEVRDQRVGVWVCTPKQEDKIAAIGVRVRRGVTYHGVAINIHPNLDGFKGIIPCGINQYGVTSFQKLGHHHSVETVREIFFKKIILNINGF